MKDILFKIAKRENGKYRAGTEKNRICFRNPAQVYHSHTKAAVRFTNVQQRAVPDF